MLQGAFAISLFKVPDDLLFAERINLRVAAVRLFDEAALFGIVFGVAHD